MADNVAAPWEIEPSQTARVLPDDLVVSVLDFLGLADLRAAAAASRQFYQSAWRAGLYIARTFVDSGRKHLNTEAQTWTDLVDHAVRKDLHLMLTFHYTLLDDSAKERCIITQVLRAILRSLPVLLSLSIKVDTSIFPDVCRALQQPAPRLRSLYLFPATWGTEEEITIPTGLFSGDAPRLCELGLERPITALQALPAFAHVVRLSIYSGEDQPPFHLSTHFPKLAHLYIHSGGNEPTVPAPCIDISGLTLQSLVFKDTRPFTPAPERKLLEGNHIPVVHHLLHQTRNMDWHSPLGWPDSSGPIHVRVHTVNLGVNILVAPADNSWRRSYSFLISDLGSPLPLCDMPGLCARVAYIRLHSDAALAFLQCTAVCAALERVRLDVASAPGSPAPLFRRIARARLEEAPRLRCPVLAELAFCAADYDSVTVRLRDVAFLCRALGPARKPALELCGVLVECEHGAALGDWFSRVGHLPDRDTLPCAQFDRGVWDDYAAIVSDDYLRQSLPR